MSDEENMRREEFLTNPQIFFCLFWSDGTDKQNNKLCPGFEAEGFLQVYPKVGDIYYIEHNESPHPHFRCQVKEVQTRISNNSYMPSYTVIVDLLRKE